LNAALDDLRAQTAPLQQVWTRKAAEAYRVEQTRWEQAATALNEILFSLGNAVHVSPTQALCGPVGRGALGTAQFC